MHLIILSLGYYTSRGAVHPLLVPRDLSRSSSEIVTYSDVCVVMESYARARWPGNNIHLPCAPYVPTSCLALCKCVNAEKLCRNESRRVRGGRWTRERGHPQRGVYARNVGRGVQREGNAEDA
ncbi:hypothetical protein PLICRDRAFT_617729 [Plicaturopsis crispa FD-325 SS-3]|nr:hypothetical protein PLICRDRAFT_617729 [Plicaturopsis crispa FD-325 SS-3]